MSLEESNARIFSEVKIHEPLSEFWVNECQELGIEILANPPRLRISWLPDAPKMFDLLNSISEVDRAEIENNNVVSHDRIKTELRFSNPGTEAVFFCTPEHFIILFRYHKMWTGKLHREPFLDKFSIGNGDMSDKRALFKKRDQLPLLKSQKFEFAEDLNTKFFEYLWKVFTEPLSEQEDVWAREMQKNNVRDFDPLMIRFLRRLDPFDVFVKYMGAYQLYVKICAYLRSTLFESNLRTFSRYARDLRTKRYLDTTIRKMEAVESSDPVVVETMRDLRSHADCNENIRSIIMKIMDSRVDRGMHAISPGLYQYSDDSDLDEPDEKEIADVHRADGEVDEEEIGRLEDTITDVLRKCSDFVPDVVYDNPTPFSVASRRMLDEEMHGRDYFVPFYGVDAGYDGDRES
jgi:hypothetical protein